MPQPAEPHSFLTTRWSVVRRAVGADGTAACEALGALCAQYWYPIYAFIRRSGKSPHDAEDLTQGFFARLIDKSILASANPSRGRLRTYLLSCVSHYLADDQDRFRAQKRGAGMVVSFDSFEAEERYATEPVDVVSPDRLFQRRWALALLEQTLRTLGGEFSAQGKTELFIKLRPSLGFSPGTAKSYEELAAGLEMPVGTLKNHIFRMRKRWRDLLLEHVSATLDNPTEEEIRAELSELLECV